MTRKELSVILSIKESHLSQVANNKANLSKRPAIILGSLTQTPEQLWRFMDFFIDNIGARQEAIKKITDERL